MDATTRKKLDDIYRLMNAAGSAGEAEAAAAAMQRLITKHNLTAEDLEGIGEHRKESYDSEFIRVAPDGKPGIQWRLNLLYVLCEYNFCAFIRHGFHGATGTIVGQPTNREAVQTMFNVTVSTVERLSEDEWYRVKNDSAHWFRIGCPSAMGWKNSFRLGFPTGLRLKLRSTRVTEMAENTKVSALVIVKGTELEEAVEEKIGKTISRKGSGPTNKDGYTRGIEKGVVHEFNERLS